MNQASKAPQHGQYQSLLRVDTDLALSGRFVLAPCLAVLLALACAAPSLSREFPPDAPAPKPLVFPKPAIRTLHNGLRVLVVERHSLPAVTLRMVVKVGAESDPPDLPGAAELTAGLLNEGPLGRSAPQIAAMIDQVGGTIDTGADWDNSYGQISVLSDHIDLAFDVMSDIIIHPAFAPSEVERGRKQTLSALEVLREDPSYLADAVFNRIVFTGTPYGHPADGTTEAMRRITPENLRRFHADHYHPWRAVLAVVGDITADDAFAAAEKYFGNWESAGPPKQNEAGDTGSASAAGMIREIQNEKRQLYVIDKPDAVQTEIRVGNLGVPRNSPEFNALTIANQILGGPSANLLFRALRSQHGLTYGASSDLVAHARVGSWEAKTSTRTAETVRSLHLMLEQMRHLREHAISGSELQSAQQYLTGHMALDFETSEDVATRLLELMVHDLPSDYWNHFPDQISRLGAEDVFTATQHYLDPDHAIVVLVGNASAFSKDLKKLGTTHFIPLDTLDLTSASLERAASTQPGAGTSR
jgi:zinc protease